MDVPGFTSSHLLKLDVKKKSVLPECLTRIFPVRNRIRIPIRRCRVKSIEQPHIKWLRKLHTSSSSSSVGQSSNSNPAIAEPFTSNHRGDVLSIYRDGSITTLRRRLLRGKFQSCAFLSDAKWEIECSAGVEFQKYWILN